MEDLSAAMAGGLQVTHAPNTTSAPHPRFQGYYKSRSVLDQAERRRRILQKQKENRLDYLQHVRNLAEDKWDKGEYEEPEKEVEPMEIQEVRVRRPGKRYKDQLMLSEWLIDVPENFETEWIMAPCPVGRRNLVIASYGVTKVYTKSGYNLLNFPSQLPGGSRNRPKHHDEMTILDCIYSEMNKTFYVLDMMCWKYQPIYDSDTEFRFYWLNTKLEEEPALGQLGRYNKYRFEPLPNFTCTKDNLQRVLGTKMSIELDGLLFYHRHTHYTFGTTPLVLWLKAYMLPEILGIPVQDDLMAQKPQSYTDFTTHSAEVKQQKQQAQIEREKASQNPSARGVEDVGARKKTPPKGGQRKENKPSKMECSHPPNCVGHPIQGSVIAPGKLKLSAEAMAQATQGLGAAGAERGGGGRKKKKNKSKNPQGQKHQPMESVSSGGQSHLGQQQVQEQFKQRQHASSQHFGQHQFGQSNQLQRGQPQTLGHQFGLPNQPQTIGHIFQQQALQCQAEFNSEQAGLGSQHAYVFGSTTSGETTKFTFSSPTMPQ